MTSFKLFSTHLLDNVFGYEKGNRRRAISILNLLNLMIHLSVIIYLHLFKFFKEPFTVYEFRSPKNVRTARRKWLIVFFCVMFGAHIAYVFYLFDNVPWLIFELADICVGLWMHLFFCSFIFYYGNFVRNCFNLISFCSSVISRITQWNWVRKILTDTQFQICCTITFTLVLSFIQWFAAGKISIHTADFVLKNWHPKQPMRVAVITDVHAGASVYQQQVDRVVEVTNELNPDMILIVGDTIDAPVHSIYDRVKSLQFLQSKYGTYLVTGNHEYYYGNWEEWAKKFQDMGIHVLQNDIAMVNGICLVGLNDISSNKSGILNQTMGLNTMSVCPHGAPIIVLEHNPAAVPQILKAAERDDLVVDLILSGHTHSGQFYVLVPYVFFFLPYLYGIYQVGAGTQLLVSAGTLYQAAPMKMVGMSQIWLLKLHGQ